MGLYSILAVEAGQCPRCGRAVGLPRQVEIDARLRAPEHILQACPSCATPTRLPVRCLGRVERPETPGPRRGYRWWRLQPLADGRVALAGVVFVDDSWEDWRPWADGWAWARCRCRQEPAGTAEMHLRRVGGLGEGGTTCGFYAYTDPRAVLVATGLPAVMVGSYVCGEVELAGIVVEHEHGYRATAARPVALYGPTFGWAWVVRFTRPEGWTVGEAPVWGLPTWPTDPPVLGTRQETPLPPVRLLTPALPA